ncbi:MAG: STAS domain-containing protein [Acidobacteria bacterium]|nr:STAS domain-containing protein [Acidobacteriota bacterium]
MALHIETKQMEPDVTVMEFKGKITMGLESQRIEAQVDELLRQHKTKLVFDLTGVEYVDSTGMGVIVSCFSKTSRAGGALRVAGLNDRVRQLFKITRVDTVLSFYPTAQAAAENPW